MSALRQVMQVIGSHHISNELLESDCDKSGGLISNGEYAWFAAGANIILYSKQLGAIVSSRSFATNQKDKSLTITFVQELHKSENSHFLLVGCSCKSFGILFVCQLPTLTTIRCIHIPNPISYISTINNESLAQDQLCDEFKVMSTVLLVGMITGAVFAVDLRHRHIENQLRRNEIVVNESRPSKLFIIRKNEDCQEVKEMSDDSDCHLAMFINENFCIYCKKQYRGKLNFSISSLLYNEEINTVAIGYSTGHFQLWDCKVMRTIYLLKDPKCVMPVTHITFLEPSDDPNNLCYLWVIQSDNSRLPNAMMIALTYEQRTMMSNGCLSYRVYKGNGIKLEMSLRRESGIGRCISALTLCNVNLFRNETDMDEDCEIRLFAMLMEIRQNVDASPESYVFLFDINQWYKAQMPSNINHLKVSNSYASFVKLPHNVSYLDLNISDKTLRPFGYNFRNNVEELYYPSSIYFECDCLLDNEIIRFKHAGVQQEILDQLLLKNWRLLINPSLIFSQCLQTNLRPFFWDKTDDYGNYSLPDQRSFVISIIVENKIMSVLSACAEEWKNGTYVSSEATILHLVQCLWKHVMVVKQYADKLCVPLFDYSGTQLGKKNERILNHCLSQMLCVKHFLEDLHNAYGIHIINVDYSYRVYTLNLVTQYFKAVTCFLNYGLLPESNEEDPTQKIIKCDFTSLIQYAIKRRLEFGDLPLYLIDAFVSNEPKGNKLIEQWQHEGGEATKGLYPPSNVQCLLRIYLNAALSNQVKDFITIYFLIDVCSSHEIDVLTANRMCNFAIEFDVENKGLNTLSRATWLLDHDMFEEAMDILASSHEWLVKDKSWDWYHWTVLKLLVYKEQYFWARFYMQLTKISLVNIDDHKFYVNLQIMNNQCFDTLIYLRARPFKEKQTLFEYFFDRCRETNRLKCLIEYLWDADEAELFFSYLKRFDDTETLTFQLLFLLQRGRHKEAIKLNQTLKASLKSNNNDALTITSLLVDRFEKNIPNIMKNDYGRLPLQSVYKKPNVVVKCMNNESKMFVMDRNKVNNLVKRQSASFTPSNSIDLFLPVNKSTRKRSPVDDMICNEKRRKIDENLLSTPNANNKIVKPIEKQVLEILNTPLVEKTIASPSITSYSSILKTKLATNKHKISFGLDKTPRSSIRFSLPDNADTTVERVDFEEVVNPQQIDNPENESFYSVSSSDANDLPTSCGTNESDGSIASEDSITSDDGSIASDDGSAESEDSEFESTRYGRFKSQSRPGGEDSNDEELEEEYIEEEDEIEEEEIEEDEIEECEIKHKGKEEEIAEECEEEEIAEEGEEEEVAEEDEVDEIVEEGEEFETYDVDSEESEREVSPKQCKNVWVAESDSELNSEVSNESNLENPCMDDLDQQNIKFDKNEEKIINNCGITSSGNEEIGSENKDKRYDSDNDENKSGHVVFINQNVDEDQEDFECVENEEYHSEKFADKAYDENEDNLEEPYEASDENNSEEPDVTIESENEENLKVQNVLDDTNEEHNLEEPNSILVGNESNPIPDDGFNHLTMPGVEADQLEMDVNQSTPFMFGESFFGQQEIPEKKPMLLFGHLYCFENEHLNVDVQANKLETQESDIVNNGVDITNKEPEGETESEIQDILELESLPESNPDNNFDTQNDTDSNNLQPECKEFNETLNDNGQFPHCPDASSNIQNFANENKINLVENLAKLDKCCQKSSLNIPQTENYSLRSSSRRSISKTKECLLDIPSTTEQKLTLNKTKLLTEPIQENKTIVIDQIKKAKSIPSVDMTPITTRSRAKSEPKQVQLEPISSNIFRSSGMVEDTSRQVRVSLSKKRSKSQENIPSIKRRSGRSKSLAPVEKSEANKRKTVFGLEEIPEEDTPNTDTNIIKTEHNTALKKKPKFNFLSNSSKKLEYVNLNPKCQQDTKIRTPRRSKSLQPDPVLTFSVVKTKPKRSSSVNMLISNDEIPTEKDDLMGVLKKALNPPEKIKKRSVTESLRSRKKQKTQNQVEEEKKEVAGSKYNSNESNQSYQFSNSSNSSEQLSPIVGNISQHMLYTPANKRNKIRMITLDSENDDSSSDESTDSNRIMTRSMIQNSSIVELDPIHRTLKSEIRPSKVSINRQRRRSSSVSSITEIKTPKKSDSSVFEKDELLFPKHKSKHIKEPIIHAPIEPSIEPPSTSERRITRFQQSILDKSLQSTSVIGQDTTTNNITMPKPEKKKITKKK